MALWYSDPLGVPYVPSQQSSLSGSRTVWMFHAFMASTEAWSGCAPSKMPLPCTQANSALDRLTPSSRYVLPAAVTSLLPETCSAGAAPPGGGLVGGLVGGVVAGVVGGVVGVVVVGGVVVELPVQ